MKTFDIDYSKSIFLKTSKTAAYPNRLNWRCEILLTRNQGIIKGRRILDLASHDGRFSYACLKLGAKHVVGVEEKDHLIKHARDNMKQEGFSNDQFHFIQNDVISYLSTVNTGQFDVILCFGFFYHTSEQIRLLREVARIFPSHFILDTSLANRFHSSNNWYKRCIFSLISHKYPALIFRTEHDKNKTSAIYNTDVVAAPTEAFFEFYFKENNYRFKKLLWNKTEITNWAYIHDYKNSDRVSYLVYLRNEKGKMQL